MTARLTRQPSAKIPPDLGALGGSRMADSDALRAKRSRWHKRGDHTLCRSETCDEAGTVERDVTPVVTSRVMAPTDPTTRGGQLWREMGAGRGLSPTHRVLLEEACRVADRLDRLDQMLNDPGCSWLRLDLDETGTEVTVKVDRLLSEARMQETTYTRLVSELRQASEPAETTTPVTPDLPVTTGGGSVVNLRAAVAAKLAQTAGRGSA